MCFHQMVSHDLSGRFSISILDACAECLMRMNASVVMPQNMEARDMIAKLENRLRDPRSTAHGIELLVEGPTSTHCVKGLHGVRLVHSHQQLDEAFRLLVGESSYRRLSTGRFKENPHLEDLVKFFHADFSHTGSAPIIHDH